MALTVRIRIQGLQTTLNAFRYLPKDASNELRDKAQELAETMAGKVRQSAREDELPQTKLMIPTIKARRDRVPVVQAGGNKRVGRHRAPAYGIIFASEFGMNRRSGWYSKPRYRRSDGLQYRPHSGNEGWWFFPTIEDEQDTIARAWQDAADAIISEWED